MSEDLTGLAKDLAGQFEDEAKSSGLWDRLNGHDKALMGDIIRDAGRIAKEAVTGAVDIGAERAQLNAQFLNLSAREYEDASRLFFQVLGKRLAQIATGLAAGALG